MMIYVEESRRGELSSLTPAQLVGALHKAFHAQAAVIMKAHGVAAGGVAMVDQLSERITKSYEQRLAMMRKDLERRLRQEGG